MDVATDEEQFWARVTGPRECAPQWFSFARAINAVILFGNSFGDLIKPNTSINLCSSWVSVPSSRDYLVVRVEDINGIMRKRGNCIVPPWRVVDDIYWHIPDKIFEDC